MPKWFRITLKYLVIVFLFGYFFFPSTLPSTHYDDCKVSEKKRETGVRTHINGKGTRETNYWETLEVKATGCNGNPSEQVFRVKMNLFKGVPNEDEIFDNLREGQTYDFETSSLTVIEMDSKDIIKVHLSSKRWMQ